MLRRTWAEWEGLKWSWYTKSQAYWHLRLSCHRRARGYTNMALPGTHSKAQGAGGVSLGNFLETVQEPSRNCWNFHTNRRIFIKNDSLNLTTIFSNGIHGSYGNSNSSWTVPERFLKISQAKRHVRCMLWNTLPHGLECVARQHHFRPKRDGGRTGTDANQLAT